MHQSDSTTSDIPKSDEVSGIIAARGKFQFYQKIDFGKTRKGQKENFLYCKNCGGPFIPSIKSVRWTRWWQAVAGVPTTANSSVVLGQFFPRRVIRDDSRQFKAAVVCDPKGNRRSFERQRLLRQLLVSPRANWSGSDDSGSLEATLNILVSGECLHDLWLRWLDTRSALEVSDCAQLGMWWPAIRRQWLLRFARRESVSKNNFFSMS